MRELTKDDIRGNRVDNIPQYMVLKYLKSNLNIYDFRVILYDRNTIKVIDEFDCEGYFIYEDDTKDVSFKKELDKDYSFER